MEELAAYCQKDVELTRDLFLYGQENQFLLYRRKGGEVLRIPVDWSWPSHRKHRGKGRERWGREGGVKIVIAQFAFFFPPSFQN